MPTCDWPVQGICSDDEADTCEHLAGLSPEARQRVEDMAVEILWNATGRRFGLCEKTFRPCSRRCGDFWGGLPTPWRIDGNWVNVTCNRCADSCSCGFISEINIDQTYAVTGIRIDGVEYDPFETVAVYDYNRIVRTDGEEWPMCQDLSVTDGAGAWSITVLQGLPVPAGGALMAGLLACELAKACQGMDGCQLPKRIQTITRQGVTVGFQDRFEGLVDLRTGIYEVDLWVAAVRSDGWAPAEIHSFDLPDDPAVLTWPPLEVAP